MSNERAQVTTAQRGLATLGLTLIVLLGWAAEKTAKAEAGLGQRWLGVATIALITITGRIVDALPLDFRRRAGGAEPSSPQVHFAQSPRLP